MGCSHASHSHSHEEDEHEEETHQHHGIVMEPHQAEEFGIEYETVSPDTFYDVFKTSGSIEASPSDVSTLTARKSGIFTLANGITEGTEVKAGEKIGSISTEGMQGGDVVQAANANLQAAKMEYERLKPLFEEGLVTASTFREAERAWKEAEALAGKSVSSGAMAVISPQQGMIQNLMVKSGEYVDAGTSIAVVAKNSEKVLKADLPAREAKHLHEIVSANFIPEGSTNIVKLRDVNGRRNSGSSSAMVNGYIPVYFSFVSDPITAPGGYAEVFLLCEPRKNVISLPREGIIEIQGNKYVYVATDEDEYEKRLVKTGASDGERIEIKEGLNKGERVVSKGASILRMVEVSAIAPPAHTHNH
ncbi:MAG: efflux RND transporter periplasmic adaptor subunit [Muribaculaceae bacterium]|nr:efflux RND transporter periplasmic adaptor subunit [Muribaculaceae bacterium]